MRYALGTIAAAVLAVGLTAGTAGAQYRYAAPGAQDDYALVASWYQQYLGRQPEPAGLEGWVQNLRSGGNPQAGILGSDEYVQRHGNTVDGFIVGWYQEVLGRTPAPNEVQGWINRLDQLRGDRTAMAGEFLSAASNELATRGIMMQQPAYQPSYQPSYYQPGVVVDPGPTYLYRTAPARALYFGLSPLLRSSYYRYDHGHNYHNEHYHHHR
jgi:hypothetical protein